MGRLPVRAARWRAVQPPSSGMGAVARLGCSDSSMLTVLPRGRRPLLPFRPPPPALPPAATGGIVVDAILTIPPVGNHQRWRTLLSTSQPVPFSLL